MSTRSRAVYDIASKAVRKPRLTAGPRGRVSALGPGLTVVRLAASTGIPAPLPVALMPVARPGGLFEGHV